MNGHKTSLFTFCNYHFYFTLFHYYMIAYSIIPHLLIHFFDIFMLYFMKLNFFACGFVEELVFLGCLFRFLYF